MKYDKPLNCGGQTLVYKTIGERKIELSFLPPLRQKYEYAPVWLMIPGGGWHHEKRSDMLDFLKKAVARLRGEGFAVVSIDYRVSTEPGVVMDDIISDCFDAARYLSHFSERLKLDSGRIGVSGHSAGGHLGLMLAYAPHDMFIRDSVLNDRFNVKAAALLSPPTIMYTSEPPTLGLNADHAYRGCSSEQAKKRTSPYSYADSSCPPTMLCAGTSDRLVYCNSSELLYKKLLQKGVKTELILSLGGGHCFEAMHDGIVPSPDFEQIQHAAAEFILNNV